MKLSLYGALTSLYHHSEPRQMLPSPSHPLETKINGIRYKDKISTYGPHFTTCQIWKTKTLSYFQLRPTQLIVTDTSQCNHHQNKSRTIYVYIPGTQKEWSKYWQIPLNSPSNKNKNQSHNIHKKTCYPKCSSFNSLELQYLDG